MCTAGLRFPQRRSRLCRRARARVWIPDFTLACLRAPCAHGGEVTRRWTTAHRAVALRFYYRSPGERECTDPRILGGDLVGGTFVFEVSLGCPPRMGCVPIAGWPMEVLLREKSDGFRNQRC